MKKRIIIIIDVAHGINVLGKCSPEKDPDAPLYFKEYIWSRKFALLLERILVKQGFEVRYTVDPAIDKEPGLSERVKRTNNIINANPDAHCIFISLHVNAAGSDGLWHNARGYSIWTTKAENNSDILAADILDVAKKVLPESGINVRKYMNKRLREDFESNFTVLYGANCPAVLIESLFQDNKEDVKLLKDKEIQRILAETIVAGVIAFSHSQYNL